MSIISNPFRTMSQHQQDVPQVKVYYKSDMKNFAKIIYNRGTTIEQIINELIKQLNLNNKLQYQINLMTHTTKEPSQGGILMRRKLRKKDQPFKILYQHKIYKFSFYLDYHLSQLSINSSFNQTILIDDNNGAKFDKEFKILKLTKDGTQKPIKIKLNTKGMQFKEEGKMEKFIDFSECQVEFGEQFVITINYSDKISLYKANSQSDFCTINKLIYNYTKNFEIKHLMVSQDHKIQNITQQRMDQIDQNCFLHSQSKKQLKQFPDYRQFMEIFKLTQVVTNLGELENDDLNVDLESFRAKILDTFSILPREQFREKLIKLNSKFKLIASCKLENMIEETEDQLISQLDNVLVSEEEALKYSQFIM